MKKPILTLLCAVMLCVMLQPGVLAESNSIEFDLNGQHLTLMFDRSEQFSNIVDGNVQACFYTFMDNPDDLYELYLYFPQNVQPGTAINPDYAQKNAPETSVVLIITKDSHADYYFAGQTDDSKSTDYAITFESVSDSGSGLTYTGTLSASMIGVADDFETEVPPISIKNARFSFTIPTNGSAPSEENPGEFLPPIEEGPIDGESPFSEPTPSPTPEVFRA